MSLVQPLVRPLTQALTRSLTGSRESGPSFRTLLSPGFLSADVTFSRLSTGTYFDSTPLMQTAAAGVPRWDHDPATGAALGLLIEQQSTQYLANSTTALSVQFATSAARTGTQSAVSYFGVPYWSVVSASATVNPGNNFGATTVPGAGNYVASIGVRAGNVATCAVLWGAAPPAPSGVVFGPGSITQVNIGNVSGLSAAADSRIYQSYAAPGSPIYWNFYPVSSSSAQTIGNYMLSACPQIEGGTYPTSYIPTTGSQATRAQDILTFTAPPTTGTLLIASDAPAGTSLINTGGTDVLVSQGPGKYAIAFTPSGTSVSYNGGTPSAGSEIAWGADWQALANVVTGHLSTVRLYPDAKTGAALQGLSA